MTDVEFAPGQDFHQSAEEQGAQARAASGEALPSFTASAQLPSLDLDKFLSTKPPEPRWQWTGYYARGDVVLIVGDPGIGKSMVCLSNAAQAALRGGEQLAEEISAGRVLFIDLESPEDVVHERFRAFGITGNVDGLDYVWRPPDSTYSQTAGSRSYGARSTPLGKPISS